jgi:inositol-pentakisphosphate 2-kinase
MANISETRPQDWKYISEGGATIVFSYVGPPNPHFDGMVLRLRKVVMSSKDLHEESWVEPEDPMIEFQQKCMERLIPKAHLPRLETVHLERPWLESLVQVHDVARPQYRRSADHVDLDRSKGVLATDLVGGNWMAVEIKAGPLNAGLAYNNLFQLQPKWAFLPTLTHLSTETRPVKSQTCRFCMHSLMKSKDSDHAISTGYCPLDLFSLDEARVKKALYSLWDAWAVSGATVNNLKIFVQGKAVHPSDVGFDSQDPLRSSC